MLRRTVTSLVLAGMLAAPSFAQTIRAELDGKPLMFDQPPVSRDGRLLVPLRGIFEGLGAEVLALPGGRIKATKGSTTVDLLLGSNRAYVNGQAVTLEVPATSLGGRTMVPLRFVSEALGADVGWDAATKTVLITSTLANAPAQPTQPTNPQPAAMAPKIFNVVHNGGATLQRGDTLLVTATGDPGAQAFVEIDGVTNRTPMPEVSSGRYEAQIPIRARMQAQRATVIVTLSKNGQESQQEAGRTVTINNADGQNNAGASNTAFDVYPAENSTMQGLRPTIHVRLDRNVSPQTVRMTLDGNDVTSQTQFLGNSIQLTPGQDLMAGTHYARVQAVDLNGRLISKDWNFNLQPGYTNAGSLDVNLTNLNNGSNVGTNFQLTGTTTPYATVDVSVQARTSLIPGVLSMAGRPFNARTTADANGNFAVNLDATNVQPNTPLNLTVQARDNAGRTGPTRTIEIIRR